MAKARAVAVPERTGLPAHLVEELEATAGQGVSQSQDDNLVPLVYILQGQSPQVIKQNQSFIPNAEAGDIWLRNAEEPIIKGDVGMVFQPCYFDRDVVEWVDRDAGGGGFVARHKFLQTNGHLETVEEMCTRLGGKRVPTQHNPNVFDYVLRSGNQLVDTRYHIGFVVREDGLALPYVVPFSSTGHTVSRTWMFKMNQRRLPGGLVAASYACTYRLTTKYKENASGSWFLFEVGDAEWVQSKEDLERGRSLHEAFAQGIKQADAPVQADDGLEAAEARI